MKTGGPKAVLGVVLLAALAIAARAAEIPRHKCVITLGNTDQMRGRLSALADGFLAFYPAVAPDARVQIDLAKVDRVTFREPPKGHKPPKGQLLALRDSSVLYGKFVRLAAESLHFDLEGTGPLAFPRAALDTLVATESKGAASSAPRDPRQHVVVLKSGSVLIGGLEQDATGLLVVRGGDVHARFRYAAVASIAFPRPPSAKVPKWARSGPALDEEEPDEERGLPRDVPRDVPPAKRLELRAIVSTLRGTRLTGIVPKLEGDRLALTLAGGHRITLPLEQILEVSFTSTGAASLRRVVLVWGAHADRSEEFPRTTAILKERLGSGWRLVENFSADLDASFRRALAGAGVLLIPEMERWGSSSGKGQLGARLKPMAQSFLRRGGNIVILGTTSSQTSFLSQAGLLDVTQSNSSSGSQVRFTPEGRRIAQGIGDAFQTTNSTMFYAIRPSLKAVALAGAASSTPIVARRAGQGWIILLGMDYYESNEQTKKLLINAMTHR